MNPIVINGDDFGLSDGVCRGILELLEMGAISNTTIMVSAYGASKTLHKWNVKSLKGLAGIHLQLSNGKPISHPKDIPSIVNSQNGNFVSRDALDVVQIDPSDVKKELTRQIETGIEFLGGLPTHLDSHQGIHRLPFCTEIYLALAAKFKIPVRGGTDTTFLKKMSDFNVTGSSIIVREWTGKNLNQHSLVALLNTKRFLVSESDVIELVTHPGYSDDYLKRISGLNITRENDLEILKILLKDDLLAKNGFRMVAFPSLSNK